MSEESSTLPVVYVDASSLKDSSCSRRLIYNNYYGYRYQSSASNYKAGYGSAIHRGFEFYYGSSRTLEDQKKAIQISSDYYAPYTKYIPQTDKEYRTPTHLVKTLEEYFKRYNPDSETLEPIKGLVTPGLLETKFTYPAILLDPRLKSPHFELIIAGTIDMIASYEGREVFLDHKSTGSLLGYKDSFFADLFMSVQMKLYTLILWKLTGQIFPFMINGIFIKRTTQAGEKAKIFDGANFERYGPRTYSEEQLQEFEKWLVERLIGFKHDCEYQHTSNALHPQPPHTITHPNFAACNPKFPCQYINVCSLNPSEQGSVLKMMNQEQYNPLKFSET